MEHGDYNFCDFLKNRARANGLYSTKLTTHALKEKQKAHQIIRVRIKAMKIYSNPNLILNKTHANKPRKDNLITDFTNSFEFIYN